MNKKFNFVEELEKEKEKEALEEAEQKESEEKEKTSSKHVRRPKNMDKFNQNKNDYIFTKSMESETFRKYPYNREENWTCSNCDNINNSSVFECVKCKFINMDIFAKIDEERSRLSKENKSDKSVKINKNKSPKIKNQEYNQYTKLNNTNIFTLIKLIDFEYNSFVEGIYCYKCYNELSKCKCIESKDKNNISNDYSSQNNKSKDNYKSEDITIDELDFNSNSTINNRQINYFGYNIEETKKDNNILIKTKTMNNENNNQKLLDIILSEK